MWKTGKGEREGTEGFSVREEVVGSSRVAVMTKENQKLRFNVHLSLCLSKEEQHPAFSPRFSSSPKDLAAQDEGVSSVLDTAEKINVGFFWFFFFLTLKQRELSCSSSEGVDEVQVGVQKSRGILQLGVVADVIIQHGHRGHGKHLPGGKTERGFNTAIAADSTFSRTARFGD